MSFFNVEVKIEIEKKSVDNLKIAAQFSDKILPVSCFVSLCHMEIMKVKSYG